MLLDFPADSCVTLTSLRIITETPQLTHLSDKMPSPEVPQELLGTEHMGPKGWIRQVLCFELPEDYDMYVAHVHPHSSISSVVRGRIDG